MVLFISVLGYLWWNKGMVMIGVSNIFLFFNLVLVVIMIFFILIVIFIILF